MFCGNKSVTCIHSAYAWFPVHRFSELGDKNSVEVTNNSNSIHAVNSPFFNESITGWSTSHYEYECSNWPVASLLIGLISIEDYWLVPDEIIITVNKSCWIPRLFNSYSFILEWYRYKKLPWIKSLLTNSPHCCCLKTPFINIK